MAQIKVTGNHSIDNATSELAIALHHALAGSGHGDQFVYDEAMRLRDAIMAGTRELDAPQPERRGWKMTVWISPSGRVHAARGCTGAGPRSRSTAAKLTRDEVFAEGTERCRCLRWWPDRVAADGHWGAGYRIGKEDFSRAHPRRDRATASGGAARLPDAWWDGYDAGYGDAVFLRDLSNAGRY